jgi:DNA-binding IclR family transcriptional regulator
LAKRNQTGARLTALAQDVGLHITTAHRILLSLVEEGIVSLDPLTKLYNLGFEVYLLGKNAQQFTLRYKLRPLLEEIARVSDDTVTLMIRSGYDVQCIDMVQGSFPIRTMLTDVGSTMPLGVGAGSQALIASINQEEIEKILAYNALRFTEYMGSTAEDIRQTLINTQKRGYGVCDEMIHPGAVSVAVPVSDAKGELLAAVTVAAIKSRLDQDRQREIVNLINKLWNSMAKKLGF